MDLAKKRAIKDLTELHSQSDKMEAHELKARRGRIHKLLTQLSPGCSSALVAVCLPDGTVTTAPEDMAAALRGHWSEVFKARPRDEPLLQQWLADERAELSPPLSPATDPRWRIRRRDIRKALDIAPSSAPGPDGIPFAAWKRLDHLAVDVLHGAMQALLKDTATQDMLQDYGEDFNASLLVFIPKKPTMHTVEHGPVFSAADVRPINVVNCDNRLLANAMRLRIEPVLAEWVSPEQRGFLPGRSMLSNVVDIDEAMAQCALRGGKGAAWFYDFQAAFPSVAHDFLLQVLEAAGLPAWLLRFVQVLYRHNHQHMEI